MVSTQKNNRNVRVNTVVYLDIEWEHKQQRQDKFVNRCDMNPQKKENNVVPELWSCLLHSRKICHASYQRILNSKSSAYKTPKEDLLKETK